MIQDLMTIGVLVILEGVLSIDNALVLAVLARSVPKELQKKVLTYGLVGAIILRMSAVFAAQHLLKFPIIKIFGALYLLYLTAKHFLSHESEEQKLKGARQRNFWVTVALVELADLAFAVDSILAAVAMTPKYWIIVTGGLLGTVMMRFAANAMIVLLEKFPKMETTAYILVGIIGLKLGLESLHIEEINFHSTHSPWFWGQWISMAIAVAYGLKKKPAAA